MLLHEKTCSQFTSVLNTINNQNIILKKTQEHLYVCIIGTPLDLNWTLCSEDPHFHCFWLRCQSETTLYFHSFWLITRFPIRKILDFHSYWLFIMWPIRKLLYTLSSLRSSLFRLYSNNKQGQVIIRSCFGTNTCRCRLGI